MDLIFTLRSPHFRDSDDQNLTACFILIQHFTVPMIPKPVINVYYLACG